MPLIVHICERLEWHEAEKVGIFQPTSLQTVGFIHCSFPEQVAGVANSFYRGREELLLLWINPEAVHAEIRIEKPLVFDAKVSSITEDEYPHLYGPLNLDAVIEAAEFNPHSTGEFQLPDTQPSLHQRD